MRELDPEAEDESGLAGAREGHLAQLFGQAGLADPRATTLTVRAWYATFGEWWESFTHGVGPAGRYLASLADEQQSALRERCRDKLPSPPFEISAMAWTVTASVS